MFTDKIKNALINLLKVSSSNIIIMLSGILVGLLLPKILGIADYGYYRTFTLYTSYVGLFHFGFSDGIYLKYGGKRYDELDEGQFRLYSRFIIGLELIISLLILAFAMIFLSHQYRFIFVCVGIYLVVNNITSYYQMISQITGRFNELSTRNILQSTLTSVILILLLVIHNISDKSISYRTYTITTLIINGLLACWYVYTYRDIVFGKIKTAFYRESMWSFIVLGFPLTISNLCSTLILTIDRQFVNVLFSTKVYAIYAFAYNLLALVTTALNSISTVLYPTMKRIDDNNVVRDSYNNLIMWVLILVSLCLAVFFPLSWFIHWFLPKYVESLAFFKIILPGLIFSSAVTLIIHNYYKIEGENVLFFKKTVIVLILSIIVSWLAYIIFKTPKSISIAAMLIMIFWYVYMNQFFVKRYHIESSKNFKYACIISIIFYITSSCNNSCITLFIYLSLFIMTTYFFYSEQIYRLFKGDA